MSPISGVCGVGSAPCHYQENGTLKKKTVFVFLLMFFHLFLWNVFPFQYCLLILLVRILLN